jgi:LuxR family quorum-sensing system transcriptional regulator CciR
MRRVADRFRALAEACTSLEELRLLVGDVCCELGFKHFALLHHSSLSSPASCLVKIDNYPEGWAEELIERGLAADDPVHLASRRVNTGFAWSELAGIIALAPRQLDILSQSRRFGIGHGFTIPVNVPGEPAGSCSFAVGPGAEFPVRRLMCAELVGAHAFSAARRIGHLAERDPRPHLSRREVQCLRLVALGKTDWEIARILGISEQTARQYVKRARSAYDVVSRTQLVALGLRDDWLSFEDLLAFGAPVPA